MSNRQRTHNPVNCETQKQTDPARPLERASGGGTQGKPATPWRKDQIHWRVGCDCCLMAATVTGVVNGLGLNISSAGVLRVVCSRQVGREVGGGIAESSVRNCRQESALEDTRGVLERNWWTGMHLEEARLPGRGANIYSTQFSEHGFPYYLDVLPYSRAGDAAAGAGGEPSAKELGDCSRILFVRRSFVAVTGLLVRLLGEVALGPVQVVGL
ncbi:hypothetical protein B0T26DRAFT_336239 [Lasiosphaeria miniovina]|uniref:Uncharacterized protein n=1 Tax=Lasiosphaeria miniovina TaxID=1954250 RepID=A0AA40AB51_9PEZI|nr:uncharacterized protein B0T26DRAFT_336239 [Lasiosphaeria miniovina]KAK0712378.1 hypothetical protein B0T26DRAFT_336239 [Lasiosphaeria miniovina]